MVQIIENPAECEIQSVIRFLTAKSVKAADIYRQLRQVYGENDMCESKVRKWVRLFKTGRTNVHDEPRSGRPSIIIDSLVHDVENAI